MDSLIETKSGATDGSPLRAVSGYAPFERNPRQRHGVLGVGALAHDADDSSLALNVAVLFARSDSIYKKLGCDVYDAERNALTFPGGKPIVAHPPCRAWSSLKWFARPKPGERRLAIWTVLQLRRCGGVLEHPKGSSLWKTMQLPMPGWLPDEWGGYTIEADQFHWGHKARKRTWLYIVGGVLPPMPRRAGEPTHVIDRPGSARKKERPNSAGLKPWCSKVEREATPIDFARWLLLLAHSARGIRAAQAGAAGVTGLSVPHERTTKERSGAQEHNAVINDCEENEHGKH